MKENLQVIEEANVNEDACSQSTGKEEEEEVKDREKNCEEEEDDKEEECLICYDSLIVPGNNERISMPTSIIEKRTSTCPF